MMSVVSSLVGQVTAVSGPLQHVVDVTATTKYLYDQAGEHFFIGYRKDSAGEYLVIFFSRGPYDSRSATGGLCHSLDSISHDRKASEQASAYMGIDPMTLRRLALDNVPEL